MATNVKFLRGQSSALSTLTAPSDGVFYLAEDTKKLNVGLLNDDGTTSVYELNKDITTYPNLKALEEAVSSGKLKPKKSSFFYLEEQNIFCIYTGTGFTQINPDTGMTGIEDNRSAIKDEDGLDFASQPITSVSYNPTTRKLIVNSGNKFVNIANFKELKAIVEANHIIGGVSSEFTITNDEEKVLQINNIDKSKITGLDVALNEKVDKKVTVIDNGDGTTTTKEWTLLSPTDQAKLAALVLGENGGGVEISGKVNASNVDGLDDWISNNRDLVDGLFSTANATKLAGIESGAQVNIIETVKLAGTAANVVDKSVNIPLASQLFPGLVMSSLAENHVKVNENGTMSINSLNVNLLTQTEGDMLVINGGDATV